MNTAIGIDSYEELRDALVKMRDDGVTLTSIARGASVGKGCVSKFINAKSKHLRGDILMRLRRFAQSHNSSASAQ